MRGSCRRRTAWSERAALAEAGEPQPFVESPAVLLSFICRISGPRGARTAYRSATLFGGRATPAAARWRIPIGDGRRLDLTPTPAQHEGCLLVGGLTTEPQACSKGASSSAVQPTNPASASVGVKGALPRQQVGCLSTSAQGHRRARRGGRTFGSRALDTPSPEVPVRWRGSGPDQDYPRAAAARCWPPSTRLSITTADCRGRAARCFSRPRWTPRRASASRSAGLPIPELRGGRRRAAGCRDWRPAETPSRGQGGRDRLRARHSAQALAQAALQPLRQAAAGALARGPVVEFARHELESRGVSG
mgnify:CR=1 FL=1